MGEIKSEEEVATFMLKHGDALVNTLGAEINNIEDNIKVNTDADLRVTDGLCYNGLSFDHVYTGRWSS